MSASAPEPETAIVLPGGGARAAYQVGVLRAIARLLPDGESSPFRIVSGTSAGAINAVMLAIHAESLRVAVARLTRLWRNLGVDQVYRSDLTTLSRHGMQWLTDVLTGHSGPARAAAMLDNSPLAALVAQAVSFDRIEAQIERGLLSAVAVNATSYATGQAVSFFAGADRLPGWRRIRRRGVRCKLAIDHIMASAAIPFVFPAIRIGDDYFMDGSVRHIAPLSPALHLGAKRVLVIAVGQFTGQAPTFVHPAVPPYPSFAQVAGHALSAIFLDNLAGDLERLQQFNRVVDMVPPGALVSRGYDVGHVDALAFSPSRDLGALALAYVDRLPRGVRYLLGGFGSTQGTGANLLSYLLFDREYTRELIKLGYADAMARRDELAQFLGEDRTRRTKARPAPRVAQALPPL